MWLGAHDPMPRSVLSLFSVLLLLLICADSMTDANDNRRFNDKGIGKFFFSLFTQLRIFLNGSFHEKSLLSWFLFLFFWINQLFPSILLFRSIDSWRGWSKNGISWTLNYVGNLIDRGFFKFSPNMWPGKNFIEIYTFFELFIELLRASQINIFSWITYFSR